MPLVKIDMIKGVRSPEEIKKLADVVQEVMLEKFNALVRDRYGHYSPSMTLSLYLNLTHLSHNCHSPTRLSLSPPDIK